MNHLPGNLIRRHSEPLLAQVDSRRRDPILDEHLSHSKESHMAMSRMARVDKNTARLTDLQEASNCHTNSSGSGDSSTASSPRLPAQLRGTEVTNEQQPQSNIGVDEDYDYWVDVADSW
jgi:hypothetical protein